MPSCFGRFMNVRHIKKMCREQPPHPFSPSSPCFVTRLAFVSLLYLYKLLCTPMYVLLIFLFFSSRIFLFVNKTLLKPRSVSHFLFPSSSPYGFLFLFYFFGIILPSWHCTHGDSAITRRPQFFMMENARKEKNNFFYIYICICIFSYVRHDVSLRVRCTRYFVFFAFHRIPIGTHR